MKRVLSFLLILLLIPCIAVSVSATEKEGYANFVDLMGMGYATIDGVVDTDFRFTGSGSNVVTFPVDVIGGMGVVEFVIWTPDTAVGITSKNGVEFSKYSMGDENLYFFYADIGKSSIETFTFTNSSGKQIYIVSARTRMTSDLIYDLTYDLTWRLGSYHTIDETDVTSTTISLDVEDYFDTSSYTTYVSGRIALDTLDCKGLDYVDVTLFTCGMSATSIVALTGNNIYLPTEISFYQSADPAVERDRYSIHVDISNKQINDWVYIYYYGVTTSSSASFRWEVPRVVGGVTQPEVSGEVGILVKIWALLTEKLPILNTISENISSIGEQLGSLVDGDSGKADEIVQDTPPLETEFDEMEDILATAPTIDQDGFDDVVTGVNGKFQNIYTDENGTVLFGAMGTIANGNIFSQIIPTAAMLGVLSFALFGRVF